MARTAAVCIVFISTISRFRGGIFAHLLVDDSAESGFALDDGIWDTHLAAEGGEEDDQLDGVNIVGDKHERGLLVLNEANNVVETVLDNIGLLADVLLCLVLLDGGGLLEETLLLLDLGLRPILVEELESLSSSVLVENLLELGDGGRDLQAKVEDLLLALEADVLGPLHHAREVALGLDVLADTEVPGPLLNERVLADRQLPNGAAAIHRVDLSLTLGAFLEPAFP